MSHSHGSGAPTDDRLDLHVRRSVLVAVVVCAVVTLIGLVALWPRGNAEQILGELGQRLPTVEASVRAVAIVACAGTSEDQGVECAEITAQVTSGPTKGEDAVFELPFGGSSPSIDPGDPIRLGYDDITSTYVFYDFQRSTPLLALSAIFVVAVLALGRWKGLGALAGLAASLAVLIVFVLPALLDGGNPLVVAVVGAAAIGFIALYLAHGLNMRTNVALLGTFASLLLTALLGWVFVRAGRFTGLLDEEALLLNAVGGVTDLRGIILAGIVIGALGVLDDVTVTQVAAVWELHHADPTAGRAELYRSAVRIGRDHISSTVNTLVLAYAGASLPLLLLFTQTDRGLADIATSEIVAVEIVRALVGSIGLVAAVPITTGLAALVIAGHDRGASPTRAAG